MVTGTVATSQVGKEGLPPLFVANPSTKELRSVIPGMMDSGNPGRAGASPPSLPERITTVLIAPGILIAQHPTPNT